MEALKSSNDSSPESKTAVPLFFWPGWELGFGVAVVVIILALFTVLCWPLLARPARAVNTPAPEALSERDHELLRSNVEKLHEETRRAVRAEMFPKEAELLANEHEIALHLEATTDDWTGEEKRRLALTVSVLLSVTSHHDPAFRALPALGWKPAGEGIQRLKPLNRSFRVRGSSIRHDSWWDATSRTLYLSRDALRSSTVLSASLLYREARAAAPTRQSGCRASAGRELSREVIDDTVQFHRRVREYLDTQRPMGWMRMLTELEICQLELEALRSE